MCLFVCRLSSGGGDGPEGCSGAPVSPPRNCTITMFRVLPPLLLLLKPLHTMPQPVALGPGPREGRASMERFAHPHPPLRRENFHGEVQDIHTRLLEERGGRVRVANAEILTKIMHT